jgi:hypothetical protein
MTALAHANLPEPEPPPEELPCIRGVGLMTVAQSTLEQRPERMALTEDMCSRIWALTREFPQIAWAVTHRIPPGSLVMHEREWRGPGADLYRTDRTMLALCTRPAWLIVVEDDRSGTLTDTAAEILTRYQRLVPRTNELSKAPAFRAALARHRELHDLGKPLVRADYDHALDVWQWILRLNPAASLSLQLAGLFHDIERLASEADERIEQNAPDYQLFKDTHARAGARFAAQVLYKSGIAAADVTRVERLIQEHERPVASARDADLATLADADALSFFSLNSPGFADYYGAEHTRKKVRYSLGRMTAAALSRLAEIRLRPDIAGLVGEARR